MPSIQSTFAFWSSQENYRTLQRELLQKHVMRCALEQGSPPMQLHSLYFKCKSSLVVTPGSLLVRMWSWLRPSTCKRWAPDQAQCNSRRWYSSHVGSLRRSSEFWSLAISLPWISLLLRLPLQHFCFELCKYSGLPSWFSLDYWSQPNANPKFLATSHQILMLLNHFAGCCKVFLTIRCP